MTSENAIGSASSSESATTNLQDGSLLLGRIVRPYIADEKLLGAVLAFEGHSETALLHVRQMSGEDPASRLAEMSVGDTLMVRLSVQSHPVRSVRATEKGVELAKIVDAFEKEPTQFVGIPGRIQGITKFGTFIELEGPAAGHRGLLRSTLPASGQRMKLGAFLNFKLGDEVTADVVEARLDDSGKLLLRVDNVQRRIAA